MFSRDPPEEGVVFNADFPQLLGRLVVGQFKADGTLVLLHLLETQKQTDEAQSCGQAGRRGVVVIYLWRSNFDEEAATLVGHLEDFGPRKSIDPEFVFVNHQTAGAHPEHDVHTFQILME